MNDDNDDENLSMLQMQHPFRKTLVAVAHTLYLLQFNYFSLEKEWLKLNSFDNHQQE